MSKPLSKKHETQLKIMNESFAQALEESYQNGITYSQQLNADRENRCYNAGREKGYNEGFEEGQERGINLGLKTGKIDGYNTGLEEGKRITLEEHMNDEGYNTGLEEHMNDEGYNTGLEEGYAKGHATQKEETKPWHTPVNLSLWIITLKDSALKPEVYIYRATGGVFRPVNNEGRFSIELHDSSIIKAEQIFP